MAKRRHEQLYDLGCTYLDDPKYDNLDVEHRVVLAVSVMLAKATEPKRYKRSLDDTKLPFNARTVYNKLHEAGLDLEYTDGSQFTRLNTQLHKINKLSLDDLGLFVDYVVERIEPFMREKQATLTWGSCVKNFSKWLELARHWNPSDGQQVMEIR